MLVAAAAAAALVGVPWAPARSLAPAPWRGIDTGLYLNGPVTHKKVAQAAAAGTSIVRITVSWREIAPEREPGQWAPADPADPSYDWDDVDSDVRAIAAAGLEPLLTISGAPRWAQEGPPMADPFAANQPVAKAFGVFAHAVAVRYSGAFEDLPRVRYFQAWNEPNISLYLRPQLVSGAPVAAVRYRAMLNAFARGVNTVHADNVVIAGGLAPFRDVTVTEQDKDWGPLSFLRSVLCLSPTLQPTCATRISADAWAVHPYTSGNATHHAVLDNDVSLGDLPKVRKVLAAAARAGHLKFRKPALWVTEFSWDSNPPDPKGVPMPLLTRWVSEAVYRMWQNKVKAVTWLQLRDQPLTEGYFQSGLRTRSGKPKPIERAFRFPFVAYAGPKAVAVWGRTPSARRGRVLVQWWNGSRWKNLAALVAGPTGIFRADVGLRTSGFLRAKMSGSEASQPFSLTVPPDQTFNPFGQDTPLEPDKKGGGK